MKTRGWISLTALLCFLGVVAFFLRERGQKTKTGEQIASAAPISEKTPKEDAQDKSSSTETDSRITRLDDGRILLNLAVEKSRELHQHAPEQDLETISALFEHYRSLYRENPTGSENLEIMKQLLGQNPQKFVFIDPQHPSLSPHGELLDRWDSAYIFHPLTATKTEIRSIGPDQTPWTADDLSLQLEQIEHSLQL